MSIDYGIGDENRDREKKLKKVFENVRCEYRK
jgi:hypothetical protein